MKLPQGPIKQNGRAHQALTGSQSPPDPRPRFFLSGSVPASEDALLCKELIERRPWSVNQDGPLLAKRLIPESSSGDNNFTSYVSSSSPSDEIASL